MPSKACAVLKCRNTSKNTKLFFMCPRDGDRRRKWFSAIKFHGKYKKEETKSVIYVCGDHFNLDEDVENLISHKITGNKMRLKKEVVPHVFKWQHKKAGILQNTPPESTRINLFAESAPFNVDDILLPSTSSRSKIDISPHILGSQRSAIVTHTETPQHQHTSADNMQRIYELHTLDHPPNSTVSSVCDKAVQANIKVRCQSLGTNTVSKLTSLLCSPTKVRSENIMYSPKKPQHLLLQSSGSDVSLEEKEFSVYTSDTDYLASEIDVEEYKATMLTGILMSVLREPKLCLGIPKKSYYLISVLQETVPLSYRNILITLKKLRLNDSYAILGMHFGLSSSSICSIFNDCLYPLSACLKQLIVWPEKHTLKHFIPEAFRYRYSDITCIIDCLEIEIEKPTDSLNQSLTWSEYKGCNTMKYLISCTADGLVNYVSTGYGGRASDSLIIQDCGYLDLLTPGMKIMADRGFKNISGALYAKGCELVRPPSVVTSTKPTAEEVMESKRIAALRIHVERVIGRLREFKMLLPHARIDNHQIHTIDNLILIASGIINIHDALIKM